MDCPSQVRVMPRGGTGVAVGGIGVAVAVGGTRVAVGGTAVGATVGGIGVAVGGTGVDADVGIGVGAGLAQPPKTRVASARTSPDRRIVSSLKKPMEIKA